MRALALFLLLLMSARHYGWQMVPAQHQADAWNIMAAVCITALVLLIVVGVSAGRFERARFSVAVGALWALHESWVAICSSAYIVAPWHVAPGQAQCAAWAGIDTDKLLALVTIVVLAYLVGARTRKS